MNRFFFFILIFFGCVQFVAFMTWRRRLTGRPGWQWALAGLFLIFNLPWAYLPLAWGRDTLPPDWVTAWVVRPFFAWHIIILFWLLLTLDLKLLHLIFIRIPRWIAAWWNNRKHPAESPAALPQPERREFLVRTARTAAWCGVLAVTGWGLVRASARPRVVKHDLLFADLPRELDGLQIAHLSDLHIGRSVTAREVDQALDTVGQLRPDLLVITGDIIDQNPEYTRILTDRLHLAGRPGLGVYGIIGNHDVYTGADAVSAGLEAGGIIMLRNRHHSLQAEGLPLSLVGLDDPGRRWMGSGGTPPIRLATRGMPQGNFPILLAHRPTVFDHARVADIPLTLCGHTHGGQFALPGGPNLADIAYEYTHGVYRRSGGLVHVSAGLGAVGLPFRLGVDAEVALLTLKKRTV